MTALFRRRLILYDEIVTQFVAGFLLHDMLHFFPWPQTTLEAILAVVNKMN